MATMVNDEVLCHALSDSETMILLDQGQREINSGRNARRSPYVAWADALARIRPAMIVIGLRATGTKQATCRPAG